MRKKTSLIILLLISNTIFAQSTKRFIRIIGNSKKEIVASKTKFYFTVSETRENKYQKTKAETFEKAYDNFLNKLNKISIYKKEIKRPENPKNYSNYGNSKTFVLLLNREKASKFRDLNSNGFRITKIEHKYDDVSNDDVEALSINAINDAKRKAKKICQNVGMRVGKILNIEDKNGKLGVRNINDKTKVYEYKVAVTFKLLD